MVDIVLMAAGDIDKGIASIANRAKTLDADIHKYGVQAMLHAQQHSDPRKVDRLLKALGKAHRAEAFKLWVQAFSPVTWNGDGVVGMHKEASKKFVPFDIEGADATPFWDFTKENAGKPLTLAALKAIVAQMEKKVEKAYEEDKIADGENIYVMRDYVKKLQQAA